MFYCQIFSRNKRLFCRMWQCICKRIKMTDSLRISDPMESYVTAFLWHQMLVIPPLRQDSTFEFFPPYIDVSDHQWNTYLAQGYFWYKTQKLSWNPNSDTSACCWLWQLLPAIHRPQNDAVGYVRWSVDPVLLKASLIFSQSAFSLPSSYHKPPWSILEVVLFI